MKSTNMHSRRFQEVLLLWYVALELESGRAHFCRMWRGTGMNADEQNLSMLSGFSGHTLWMDTLYDYPELAWFLKSKSTNCVGAYMPPPLVKDKRIQGMKEHRPDIIRREYPWFVHVTKKNLICSCVWIWEQWISNICCYSHIYLNKRTVLNGNLNYS